MKLRKTPWKLITSDDGGKHWLRVNDSGELEYVYGDNGKIHPDDSRDIPSTYLGPGVLPQFIALLQEAGAFIPMMEVRDDDKI